MQQFYQQFIYPKLQPRQRVWVVPGVAGPLQDGIAPPAPPYLNDTLFLQKIQARAPRFSVFRAVANPRLRRGITTGPCGMSASWASCPGAGKATRRPRARRCPSSLTVPIASRRFDVAVCAEPALRH
jgi:hypothetical protein